MASVVEGRGQYEFVITDNGIGISEEFKAHIFADRAQLDNSCIGPAHPAGCHPCTARHQLPTESGA